MDCIGKAGGFFLSSGGRSFSSDIKATTIPTVISTGAAGFFSARERERRPRSGGICFVARVPAGSLFEPGPFDFVFSSHQWHSHSWLCGFAFIVPALLAVFSCRGYRLREDGPPGGLWEYGAEASVRGVLVSWCSGRDRENSERSLAYDFG